MGLVTSGQVNVPGAHCESLNLATAAVRGGAEPAAQCALLSPNGETVAGRSVVLVAPRAPFCGSAGVELQVVGDANLPRPQELQEAVKDLPKPNPLAGGRSSLQGAS
jgi:hypothetical protein